VIFIQILEFKIMQQSIISVQFNNQSLLATMVNDVPHVALKPICENLGIDWDSQRKRIERHPVLNSTTVMITAVAQDGKLREMLMMPIKFLNGWLFGIDASRVKAEAKEAVIKYQRECFEVLANHFMPKQPASAVISAKDRTMLKDAVNKISYKTKDSHQTIYWRLFRRYEVDKVELLPAGKLDEMLAFLGVDRTTLQPKPQPALPQIPDDMVMISAKRYREMEQSSLELQFADLKHIVEQSGGLVLMKCEVDRMKGVLKA
jgi:cob(I)alamin adenosyltransferase